MAKRKITKRNSADSSNPSENPTVLDSDSALATDTLDATSENTILSFRCGTTWLAVPVDALEEICERLPLTPLPQTPSHVPGVVNLRGQALPILDLTIFLELGSDASSADDTDALERTLVVRAHDMHVGILADEVAGIRAAPQEAGSLQSIQGEMLRQFASAEIDTEQGVMAILDLESLLERARVQ